MIEYRELLHHVLEFGEETNDRTGVGTISTFGYQLRINLQDGFPLLTTKKMAWNAIVSELLWFLEGSTDERRLCEITHGTRSADKSTIWTGNAQADYWKPKARFDGDLGDLGYAKIRNFSGIDQYADALNEIKNNPTSRRILITHLDPSTIQNAALPPCHVLHQYSVKGGKLHCSMYQRSADAFLGVPFNIASYALLTHIMAAYCGLKVGDLIMSFGDLHIYNNHLDQVYEQLGRECLELPSLVIHPFSGIVPTKDRIELLNYHSHGPLKAPMAV
ncbi:thymidylate synthase [Ralstonia phage RSP15]|uniref:thymidylate synthase n=1 Tax=Ralstonia phage RSP15 TaxID=1785960 RepID=UPI00074D3324|nr:thymidylate synthase [Ralstonia phage RSP15]BAU40122.1 thymidylate synthase [Ralstonia phage RSP15]